MLSNSFLARFYEFSQWMIKYTILNLLWILFTLLGFIFVGIMPASTATFSIIRKWLRGDREIPIYSTFWSEYRSSFIPTNIFGLVLLVLGTILYVDYRIVLRIEGALSLVLLIGLKMIGIFFIILTLYIIPVFIHFQLKTFQYLKYALLLGIGNFHITFLMVVCLIILFYFFNFIPSLAPFFAVSLPSFVIMGFANRAFSKVNKRGSNEKEYLTLK